MEPTSKRSVVSTAKTGGAALSRDVLWEILLRVPAKPLWRFRAACPSWGSLFSDPSFISAHPALRPGLILTLAGNNDDVIHMTDLSGNVVRRISIAPEAVGVASHPGPLYLLLDRTRVRVVDPDTGAISTLPIDDLQGRVGSSFEGSYALGRVPSTGQHKVLRVVSRCSKHIEQHCDVLTLGERRWRPVASAPLCVKFHIIRRHIAAHNAVIQGVVYFLPHRTYPSFDVTHVETDLVIRTNCVMAFDLETEEWRPTTLPGPPARSMTDKGCELKLANLNGNLAMLCHSFDFRDHHKVAIDVWFATDLEKGAWVKEHSIRLKFLMFKTCMFIPDIQLLTVLDDGRVLFYYSGNQGLLEPNWRTSICDPRTKSCKHFPQNGVRYIIGMYTGSM
jgi:F-box interacting protein